MLKIHTYTHTAEKQWISCDRTAASNAFSVDTENGKKLAVFLLD